MNLETQYESKALLEAFAYARSNMRNTVVGNYFRGVFDELIEEIETQTGETLNELERPE